MTNRVRLTESQLHRVIKESVKRIISEMETSTIAQAAGEAGRSGKGKKNLPQFGKQDK